MSAIETECVVLGGDVLACVAACHLATFLNKRVILISDQESLGEHHITLESGTRFDALPFTYSPTQLPKDSPIERHLFKNRKLLSPMSEAPELQFSEPLTSDQQRSLRWVLQQAANIQSGPFMEMIVSMLQDKRLWARGDNPWVVSYLATEEREQVGEYIAAGCAACGINMHRVLKEPDLARLLSTLCEGEPEGWDMLPEELGNELKHAHEVLQKSTKRNLFCSSEKLCDALTTHPNIAVHRVKVHSMDFEGDKWVVKVHDKTSPKDITTIRASCAVTTNIMQQQHVLTRSQLGPRALVYNVAAPWIKGIRGAGPTVFVQPTDVLAKPAPAPGTILYDRSTECLVLGGAKNVIITPTSAGMLQPSNVLPPALLKEDLRSKAEKESIHYGPHIHSPDFARDAVGVLQTAYSAANLLFTGGKSIPDALAGKCAFLHSAAAFSEGTEGRLHAYVEYVARELATL